MRKRFPLVATLFLVLAILACNLPQPGPTTEAPPVLVAMPW